MHSKTINEVFEELRTSPKGLSNEEAGRRLSQYGLNEIKEKKKISPLKVFLQQFNNTVVYILIGAVIISSIIGFTKSSEPGFPEEFVEAVVIIVLLVVMAVLGFYREYNAEKEIEALKKLTSLKATVIRDGAKKDINSGELVPGDIIVLETGDKVPADSRLIEIFNLQTQESALTGESQPVKKSPGELPEKAPVADRKNTVFAGTIVVSGRAKAVVASTGMQTEIGKIAKMIQGVEQEDTPLQKKMDQLGNKMGIITIIIAVIVFGVGLLVHEAGIIDMLLVSVSLAVAAIPEGLPLVVTISLANGTQRMLKRNALVRRLPSVETLGETTVICTDKTGTLTMNQMTVKKIFTNGKIVDVEGTGYETKGRFLWKKKPVDAEELELILKIGALNNNSELRNNEIIGDPTEGCLIVSAAKAGLIKDELEVEYQKIDEMEFTSERKMMTTIHKHHGEKIAYVKGAPEIVLKLCNYININGKVKKLAQKEKDDILDVNKDFADGALRVLAFAYKTLMDANPEKNLVFAGLQGMIDPPREEVKMAIDKCHKAGIKVVMITGDHEITAKAVAREIGLTGKSMTGSELDELNVENIVDDISIFARVNPEHKIKIIDALKKKGYVVAMTGDGVNDAPALKKADIGIAMGITGTDVAKEASDIILTDDNFASIVNAVEEGRGIYDNIRKYFGYLVSCNIGEVLIVFFGSLAGLPLILTAIQLLMINLVTDGLPAFALSADPFEPNAMSRKPRPRDEPIYNGLGFTMTVYPIILTITTLSVFLFFYKIRGNLDQAETAAFITICISELYRSFSSRSTIYPVTKIGFFKNKWLLLAVFSSLIIAFSGLFVPALGKWFNTVPLSFMDVIVLFAISSIGTIVIELYKHFKTRNELDYQQANA